MKIRNRKIKDLIRAEYNPRELTKEQETQLKDSLLRFGIVDPVIVNIHPDRKDIIVGGHQRTKVWESLGNDNIDTVEVNLTLEKEKELNVRLNKNTGQFDMEMLQEHFETDELIEWGFDENEVIENNIDDELPIIPEVEFSEFLNESNNYVVLFFDNDIDWLQAETHFELKTVKSKRGNGKEWSKGVGRVVNGANYLKEITKNV